jgi:hypothetical protein
LHEGCTRAFVPHGPRHCKTLSREPSITVCAFHSKPRSGSFCNAALAPGVPWGVHIVAAKPAVSAQVTGLSLDCAVRGLDYLSGKNSVGETHTSLIQPNIQNGSRFRIATQSCGDSTPRYLVMSSIKQKPRDTLRGFDGGPLGAGGLQG